MIYDSADVGLVDYNYDTDALNDYYYCYFDISSVLVAAVHNFVLLYHYLMIFVVLFAPPLSAAFALLTTIDDIQLLKIKSNK
jgi:hypothetical protein